jgi:hypothetical protein
MGILGRRDPAVESRAGGRRDPGAGRARTATHPEPGARSTRVLGDIHLGFGRLGYASLGRRFRCSVYLDPGGRTCVTGASHLSRVLYCPRWDSTVDFGRSN